MPMHLFDGLVFPPHTDRAHQFCRVLGKMSSSSRQRFIDSMFDDTGMYSDGVYDVADTYVQVGDHISDSDEGSLELGVSLNMGSPLRDTVGRRKLFRHCWRCINFW